MDGRMIAFGQSLMAIEKLLKKWPNKTDTLWENVPTGLK
jgi:hypothetical protein